ncbi:MAG: hypothetical protein J4F47_01835 [Alphaproteobacteria bacterium]|nr:hypothetical protein [Alphaproteobacteria bacterium]
MDALDTRTSVPAAQPAIAATGCQPSVQVYNCGFVNSSNRSAMLQSGSRSCSTVHYCTLVTALPGARTWNGNQQQLAARRPTRSENGEWDRIETVAAQRGIAAGELVRATAIAATADGPALTGSSAQLVAQIEQIFRYTHILATEMRGRMLTEGRDAEMEELIRSARTLQGKLRKRSAD